jgi:hypothetical protein
VTRAGLSGIGLIFCCGLWLIAAPFVLRYQPAGGRWVLLTEVSVVVGAILAAAGFAAAFVVIAGRVRELYAIVDPPAAARDNADAGADATR